MSRSRSNKRKITVALLGALFSGVSGNPASAQDVSRTMPITPIVVKSPTKSSNVGKLILGTLATGAVANEINRMTRKQAKGFLQGEYSIANQFMKEDEQTQKTQEQVQQLQAQLA